MAAEGETRLYRFDPVDTSGVFLGLGLMQCGFLGGGLVLSVGAFTYGLPLLLAAMPVGAGAVASFVRIGGYAVWEWLPLLTGWLWMRVGRGSRWFSPFRSLAGPMMRRLRYRRASKESPSSKCRGVVASASAQSGTVTAARSQL